MNWLPRVILPAAMACVCIGSNGAELKMFLDGEAPAPIVYKTAVDQKLSIFRFSAAGTVVKERRPALVFIHGGYWRALDKSDFSFVAAPFLAQRIAVAVLNYDLCPDVTIAAIVDECRRAMAWLSREGGAHGAPLREAPDAQ